MISPNLMVGVIARHALFLMCLIFAAVNAPAHGQVDPFATGWRLDQEASSLTFQSVKNASVVETSAFANFEGTIDTDGLATVRIQLNSVDTKIDLRNVRMRFLFFETFKFPEAKITARIDRSTIDALAQRRRMQLPLDYELDLHGVKKTLQAPTVVTLITDDLVSVASVSPIAIAASLFGLEEGVKKLEDAAKVSIVPSGSVSFDFVFRRGMGDPAGTTANVTPAKTAIETSGNFSEAECSGRFEILSRTGAIYFKIGSAQLDPGSGPLLSSVVDIVQRCPALNIVVEGHTDSDGSDASNQLLSEARARTVSQYLIASGVDGTRVRSVGFGEARPVAANDTDRNRGRNRRIEFAVGQ